MSGEQPNDDSMRFPAPDGPETPEEARVKALADSVMRLEGELRTARGEISALTTRLADTPARRRGGVAGWFVAGLLVAGGGGWLAVDRLVPPGHALVPMAATPAAPPASAPRPEPAKTAASADAVRAGTPARVETAYRPAAQDEPTPLSEAAPGRLILADQRSADPSPSPAAAGPSAPARDAPGVDTPAALPPAAAEATPAATPAPAAPAETPATPPAATPPGPAVPPATAEATPAAAPAPAAPPAAATDAPAAAPAASVPDTAASVPDTAAAPAPADDPAAQAPLPEGASPELQALARKAIGGAADAEHDLGTFYAIGMEGMPQSFERAAYWYRRAADQGVVNAQYNLGVLLERGLGVPQDSAAAVAQFRKAASKGHPDAQNALGVAYLNGAGVPRDPAQALDWFRQASAGGNPRGAYNMGQLYETGALGGPDPRAAAGWYRIAADAGNAEAREALDRLQAAAAAPRTSFIPIEPTDAPIASTSPQPPSAETAQADALLGTLAAQMGGTAPVAEEAPPAAAEEETTVLSPAPAVPAPRPRPAARAQTNRSTAAQTPPAAAPAEPADTRPATAGPAPRRQATAPATTASPPTQAPEAPAATGGGDAQLKQIQQFLAMLNYDPGPADGQMGRKTGNAIAAFQRSRKLPVDRQPSNALLEALRQAAGANAPDWTPGHF